MVSIRQEGIHQAGWGQSSRMVSIRQEGVNQAGWYPSGKRVSISLDGVNQAGWYPSGRRVSIRQDGVNRQEAVRSVSKSIMQVTVCITENKKARFIWHVCS